MTLNICYLSIVTTFCLSLHHTGVPSPPANLSSTANTSSPSAKIEWDPPQYIGAHQGEPGSIKYVITIEAINYTASVEGNSTRNAYIIQAGNETMVKFNITYDVKITTIGMCGIESDPANIDLEIKAYGRYINVIKYFIFKILCFIALFWCIYCFCLGLLYWQYTRISKMYQKLI